MRREQNSPVNIKPLSHKVLVNEHGTSLHPAQAFHVHGVCAKIIFERSDGWALGAPSELEAVAYDLWSNFWVSFRRWPGYERRPISEYTASRSKK